MPRSLIMNADSGKGAFIVISVVFSLAAADLGPYGEEGVTDTDGNFIPGTSGADWPHPDTEDLHRLYTKAKQEDTEKGNALEATAWTSLSWKQVNCCQRLVDNKVWEDVSSGVPDCFCRDILVNSRYKTAAVCNLRQACENSLRDFNRVFGEGYMHAGLGHIWDTESPARSCQYSDFSGGWYNAPCGRTNILQTETWTDPYARENVLHTDVLPSKTYGTKKEDVEKSSEQNLHAWHWLPGDLPLSKKKWHGDAAGDSNMDKGVLTGASVYPGVEHPECCVWDRGINSTCCRNAARRVWKGPSNAPQADCMFAVKRAICAYHFWECDGSLRDEMYPGVCKDTCDDVPKLCGTIPSTGRPLLVNSFTLGNFYYKGCVDSSRKHVKDCTSAATVGLLSCACTISLHLGVALLMIASHI